MTLHMVEPLDEKTHDSFYDCLQRSFRKVCPVARRIVEEHTPSPRTLARIMRYALYDKSPSDYSFLFLTSFGYSGKQTRRVLDIAAAIHLIQTSTFVIDDILDGGDTRAGRSSVVKRFGLPRAIVIGELLQSIALSHISSHLMRSRLPHRCQVIALFSQLVEDVYVGQYLDIKETDTLHTSFQPYYRMIALTTGNFLSRVAESAALLAGLPRAAVLRISRFGYHYGMALQICDDVIDVANSTASTHKTFASDIKQRRSRLPAILALRRAKGTDQSSLRSLLGAGRRLRYKETLEVIRIMKSCGAIDKSVDILKEYIAGALESISFLRTTRAKTMLELLALDLLNDLED